MSSVGDNCVLCWRWLHHLLEIILSSTGDGFVILRIIVSSIEEVVI